MKKILLLLIIFELITHSLKAQEVSPLTYSEVVQAEGVSKEELYNRAKLWMASAFVDSDEVLRDENRDGGYIMVKPLMEYNPRIFSGSANTKGYISYELNITVKDGRYKYTLSNFRHKPTQLNLPDATRIGTTYVATPVASEKQLAAMRFGLITTEEEAPYIDRAKATIKWRNKVWADIKIQIDEYVQNLIPLIKDGMNNPAPSEEEDW